MLRSLARRLPASPSRGGAAARHAPPIATPDGDYLDLFALVLESDSLGEALRALVDIKMSDGEFSVFSVLGIGDFVLEVEGSAQSALLYELSTGWSLTLVDPRDGGALAYSADPTRAGRDGASARENVNFIELAWLWLVETVTSPFGILATMVGAIMLLTWMAYRLISRLQRRALGTRR